ncbi:MAG: aspartate aminotransferase family protein [Myxococcota bacterium]
MLTKMEAGQPVEAVLDALKAKRSNDASYDGRMFGMDFYASADGQQVAEAAYLMYMWENRLDPTVFPSVVELESEIIAMAASHLGGDATTVVSFTSGGTESVLLAVKTARDKARAERNIATPNMVLPLTAHPCFHKGAAYFDVEARVVPVDPTTFQADVDAMREAIDENTVLLVGSAPSFAHGVVDPIEAIGALGLERNIPVHVDGCIGGFLLPYFRRAGAEVPPFDFSVPGVTSMSMDFHKYAYAAKGASVVLYKDASFWRHQVFAYSGWPGYTIVNPTIQSSKSAGPLAATWAVLRHYGDDGYLAIGQQLKEARDRIVNAVDGIEGLQVLVQPHMSLVAIGTEGIPVFALLERLGQRGWHLRPQLRLGDLPESFHMTILPRNLPYLEAFIADLRTEAQALRGTEAAAGQLAAMLASVDLSTMTDGDLTQLIRSAGLVSGGAPGAEVNNLLNALQPEMRDRLASAYFEALSLPTP